MLSELIDETRLMDVDLLYEFNGRWKYKFCVGSQWMTAPSKKEAIDRAREVYAKTPQEELLTRAQRAEKADKDEFDLMHKTYGRYTVTELQDLYVAQGDQLESLHLAANREFNGNGGRRTAAAVAADGARETAEFRSKLKRYIDSKIS